MMEFLFWLYLFIPIAALLLFFFWPSSTEEEVIVLKRTPEYEEELRRQLLKNFEDFQSYKKKRLKHIEEEDMMFPPHMRVIKKPLHFWEM